MTRKQKERAIKKLAYKLLWEAHKAMRDNVEKAMNSGAIDIDSYDPVDAPMIEPKTIVCAILINESDQFKGRGTRWENQMRKNMHNIIRFL